MGGNPGLPAHLDWSMTQDTSADSNPKITYFIEKTDWFEQEYKRIKDIPMTFVGQLNLAELQEKFQLPGDELLQTGMLYFL